MKAAGVFSNHMVLMRDKEICIFGTGEEQEKVRIEIDRMETMAVVHNGIWNAVLPPHAAGGPFVLKITGNDDEIEISDVMYGEVWFAGGQSNMELELQDAAFGKEELAKADYGNIRYYNVIKAPFIDDEILEQEAAQCWHMCCNSNFGEMSAVAYFFAKKMYEQLQVPIGIIDCYQGGTSISCWLSEKNLMSIPAGVSYMEEYKAIIAGQTEGEYEQAADAYAQQVEAYELRVEECKRRKPDITMEELNDKAGVYPWPPPIGEKSLFRPCGLYETMISRVAPYTVKGVLYYQGEEDAQRTNHYDQLLVKLIAQFRRDWKDSELPFMIVQLPMFTEKNATEDYSWPRLRLAQEHVHRLVPYTGLTVLLDLGEYNNIHPVDKMTPGNRLALQVLERVYKEPVEGSSMFFSYAEMVRNKLCISFINTYGKLEIRENALKDIQETEIEGMPSGFEVSADGMEWLPACAVIKKEQMIVWNDKISEPAYVRYGYFNYGKVNVYNRAGLPLAPFNEQV